MFPQGEPFDIPVDFALVPGAKGRIYNIPGLCCNGGCRKKIGTSLAEATTKRTTCPHCHVLQDFWVVCKYPGCVEQMVSSSFAGYSNEEVRRQRAHFCGPSHAKAPLLVHRIDVYNTNDPVPYQVFHQVVLKMDSTILDLTNHVNRMICVPGMSIDLYASNYTERRVGRQINICDEADVLCDIGRTGPDNTLCFVIFTAVEINAQMTVIFQGQQVPVLPPALFEAAPSPPIYVPPEEELELPTYDDSKLVDEWLSKGMPEPWQDQATVEEIQHWLLQRGLPKTACSVGKITTRVPEKPLPNGYYAIVIYITPIEAEELYKRGIPRMCISPILRKMHNLIVLYCGKTRESQHQMCAVIDDTIGPDGNHTSPTFIDDVVAAYGLHQDRHLCIQSVEPPRPKSAPPTTTPIDRSKRPRTETVKPCKAMLRQHGFSKLQTSDVKYYQDGSTTIYHPDVTAHGDYYLWVPITRAQREALPPSHMDAYITPLLYMRLHLVLINCGMERANQKHIYEQIVHLQKVYSKEEWPAKLAQFIQ